MNRRSPGRRIDVSFNGELRNNQKEAINELLKFDCGVLSAATAFGKTVTCCGLITEIKASALILLESSALVEQWEKAFNTFLEINEGLPEYHTKTGRTKKRKSIIGIIHGAKYTSTGIIDIAMAGSLCKKGEYHPRLKEYGLVLVDECHHSDSESYIPVYEKDLKNAAKDIVISSPTLGKNKVYRIISLLKERQEAGVKITVATWHPEIYKYGKDEHRIELMELLRNSGFHIELMKESCQHYAVIDGEIVWYGSMNLLSKDDVEDNIMRVASKEIAEELLEMTFNKDTELTEYQLPMQ